MQATLTSPEQLELFDAERWPRKPYCATTLESGLRIRTLKIALNHPYIQANPPNLRVWSIYDIDREGGAIAWEDAMLPPPAWSATNRINGHAHLVWGLSAPVLVDSPDMRLAPLRLLCAIEAAFREQLQADQGYSGLITKNPAHPLWRTLRGPRISYELAELAEWIDLSKHIPKRNPETIGLGRNVMLFDWLRKWAYTAVRRHRELRNRVLWDAEVFDKCCELNGDFATPMHFSELKCIAKSVSKWVWQRDRDAERKFLQRQTDKGRQGGIASGAARLVANENQRASARLMNAAGKSLREIAEELGVGKSTISRWVSHEA